MKDITPENRHSYCRACLAQLKWRLSDVKEKHDTFKKEELAKSLQQLTAQPVTKNDKYPKYLCRECFKKVQDLQDFRELALQSMRVLKKVLEPIKKSVDANNEWLSFQCSTNKVTKAKQETTDYAEKTTNEITAAEQLPLIECKEEMDSENLLITNITIEPVKQLQEMRPQNGYLDENEFTGKLSSEEMEINDHQIEQSFDDDHKTEDNILTDTSMNSDSDEQLESSDELLDIDKKKRSKISGKYSCKLCHRHFRMQQNLEAHARTHQGLKPFQCDKCERGYCKSTSLRVHMREKHSDTLLEIACPYEGCDKVFHKNASFKLHYRLKHRNDKPKLCTYICEDCGKVCKNIVLFREHRYKHGPVENYPYRCEQCGKYFISQRYYKDHLVRHTGIKNFECPECGMRKATRNELLTHIHNHTRKFTCTLCPKEYTSAESLKKHDLTIHKGIRTHACLFCNESFGDSSTLKYHIMRHTGEMPFECSLCNKRFRQRVSLRTHMQKQHEVTEKDKS